MADTHSDEKRAIDTESEGRGGSHGTGRCEKKPHGAGGYLHLPEYDGPYDVDGVTYCGRCHRFIDVE